MAQALWGCSPGCGLPGCSASQHRAQLKFLPSHLLQSAPDPSQEMQAQVAEKQKPWLRTQPSPPFRMTPSHPTPQPPAGAYSRVPHSHPLLMRTHTHTHSKPGAAGSGTRMPSLGALSASVPRGYLGHAPSSHTSAPQQPPAAAGAGFACSARPAADTVALTAPGHAPFATPWLQPARLLCPRSWNFPGKNSAVPCHVLLQETFQTQGLNQQLFHLQRWRVGSSTALPGKPPRCWNKS